MLFVRLQMSMKWSNLNWALTPTVGYALVIIRSNYNNCSYLIFFFQLNTFLKVVMKSTWLDTIRQIEVYYHIIKIKFIVFTKFHLICKTENNKQHKR